MVGNNLLICTNVSTSDYSSCSVTHRIGYNYMDNTIGIRFTNTTAYNYSSNAEISKELFLFSELLCTSKYFTVSVIVHKKSDGHSNYNWVW